MPIQYDTRRDQDGWTVFERGTGQVVVLACASQCGLAFLEADDLAHRLNRRRLAGDRSLLQ